MDLCFFCTLLYLLFLETLKARQSGKRYPLSLSGVSQRESQVFKNLQVEPWRRGDGVVLPVLVVFGEMRGGIVCGEEQQEHVSSSSAGSRHALVFAFRFSANSERRKEETNTGSHV